MSGLISVPNGLRFFLSVMFCSGVISMVIRRSFERPRNTR